MSAPKTFKIYEKHHASGNLGYRVDMGIIGGRRVFKSFSTKAAAEKHRIACVEAEEKKKPVELRDLDEVSKHEVLAALARLRTHNATITTAVAFYLKHARPPKAHAKISEVMNAFKAVKMKAGRSEKYLETAWKSFFVPFRDQFKDRQVADITSDAVEKYIYRSKKWNATTRNAHLRHLSVLFNFAVERGYSSINPFKSVERPKKPVANSSEKVMSVADVIKLLQFAREKKYKGECASLVLVLFCGVRVDEVRHLTWDKIHLDEARPVIVLDQTKANRRRVNLIPGNALDWLKELRTTGSIVSDNYEARMKWIRKGSKARCRQNSARISFASYHVAMFEDPAKTSLLLGHQSPALLWNTYRALVTKEEAKRYWKITPDYTGEMIKTDRPSASDLRRKRMEKIAVAIRK